MRSVPAPWYAKAAAALAAGKPYTTTAKELGIGISTLQRHLRAPASVLKRMVEEARAAALAAASDELAPLRGKALQVLDAALDAGDVNAAKALLSKLVASPADTSPQEATPEPEISEDDAGREMALAFPAVADLARIGKLSPEVVEMLRSAARAFLADDLRPRPPIDVEAERVEITPPAAEAPAASAQGGAAVIPIR